jgi:hypothetical protein
MLNGMNSFKTREGIKDIDPKYNIKLDVDDLSPTNFAMLSGPAFTLIYAVLILFTGPLSDNLNRTKMICFSCIGWSTMTYLSSRAT